MSAAVPEGSNPARGIALKVLSVIVFIAMFSCIKAAGDAVPTGQAVFFRSCFALPPILACVVVRGALAERLRGCNPAGHLRGICGASSAVDVVGRERLP